MKIEIVHAVPEDAKGIQEVFFKTWLDTYPNEEFGITVDDIKDRFKNAFTDEVLKKRAEKIAHPPEGHILLLAKDGGKVIGLLHIIKHLDINEVYRIYILPEYQRRKIGTLLWNEAKKFFDQNKDIIIKLAAYNIKAISFYKKLGFEDTGRHWKDEKYKMKNGSIIPSMEMVKRTVAV